jgi:3-oxoacyl-(acyl-carrier-protein) synthase
MSWDIVGTGAVTCIGEGTGEVFEALCDGRSGVAPLRAFEKDKYRVQHAYEIDDRSVPGRDEPGRATRWLRRAVAEALRDAGMTGDVSQYPVLVGTTLRELRTAELWWRDRDGTRLEPADLHFSRAMREEFGTTHTQTIASACAASLYALAMATDLIELGRADTVVVAGTDSIAESSFGGLDRVQSPPPEAIRPFDTSRRGMLMGEGAVAVVLRRTGTAARPALARLRGVALNCDASHPTMPDASSVAEVIRDAHERAEVKPHDIDLAIVHGSGTTQNDVAESQALHEVFAHTGPGPLVTSIKSGAGHTCGGSGLLSVVTALMAIRRGTVPPILGLDDPIAESEGLRLVAGRAAVAAVNTAQIHAIGLGGINGVAVVEGAE